MAYSTQKVLFAISDTGGGHRSAATAMVAALSSYSDIECTLSDLLRATGFPFLRKAPEIYDYCSRKQLWLNNLFFEKTNSINRINLLAKLVYRQASPRIATELSLIRPDLLVSVHPLVTSLLVAHRRATRASWPIITVVTDLATIHASWATPGADLYLAPTEEAYQALIRHGIACGQIILTGFPVHPKFSRESSDRLTTRQKLGLDQERFSVLLTGGGVGAGNMAEWIQELEKNCRDKQIMVVTGRNQALFNELQTLKNRFDCLHVFGFVDNMETLMAASDVVISKAGPGTIMEAVTMRRPLLITEAVGIQETGNIDFVVNNRLGHFCPDPRQGCRIINALAAESDFTYPAAQTPLSDGSLRIADIIRQFATGTVRRSGIEYSTASLFRGA